MIQFPLGKEETLLWSGTPRQGLLVLRPADMAFIPFSLMWGGFAVFWEASVIRTGAPWFMRLWGVPFVLVGLYMAIGRFFYDAWRRAHTSYGLTNERVIIASGGFRSAITSLNVQALIEMTISERPDGSGTIIFGHPSGPPRRAIEWPGASNAPAFEMIPSARAVYDMIRDAQRSATRTS